MSFIIVSILRSKKETKENGDQGNGLEAHRRAPDSEDTERGIAFNGLPGRILLRNKT